MTDGKTFVLLHALFSDEEYLKPEPFGDVDADGLQDSVLVMPEFLYTDSSKHSGNEGQAFVFTKASLGKLLSPEPGCNHIANMFLLEDIDEDGIREIGLYTSSCASRYKALRVFALRKGTWREMGSVPFDIHCPDPPKQERVRKVKRSVFEMRYVTEGSGPDYPCTDDQWHRDTIR